MPYAGELAALTTALCWAITSVIFTEAGKRIGAARVNNIRLVLASLIYLVVTLITYGSVWPFDISWTQLGLLTVSALIGLVLGDLCGFKALVMIGPRITTLLWSTSPIMVTVIAWIFLDEELHPIQITGIVITLAGIAWVISERQFKNGANAETGTSRRTLVLGVVLGLLAAAGQGIGLVLSKQAMLYSGDVIPALPASFVRMLAGVVMSWSLAAARGKWRHTTGALSDRKAMGLLLGGAFCGPFLGVWMSMVAISLIEAGVASTLNNLTPITILPLVYLYYNEKVSLRACLGAVLSVGGVAMLILSEQIAALF